jgi:hypothetical protein
MIPIGTMSESFIPYFAMSVEPRDSRASAVTDKDKIRKALGGHAYKWLSENVEFQGGWRLLMTRDFVPPRSAVYRTWLLFENDDLEQKFVATFPNLTTEVRLQRLSKNLEQSRASLDKGLLAGGYDLSKSAPESRVAVARAYIEKHEQIAKLQSELDGVLRQVQERAKWGHLSVADF